ncbi:hypothetical protein GCM10018954_006930 [Kutzneria kofuensis]
MVRQRHVHADACDGGGGGGTPLTAPDVPAGGHAVRSTRAAPLGAVKGAFLASDARNAPFRALSEIDIRCAVLVPRVPRGTRRGRYTCFQVQVKVLPPDRPETASLVVPPLAWVMGS